MIFFGGEVRLIYSHCDYVCSGMCTDKLLGFCIGLPFSEVEQKYCEEFLPINFP